MGRSKRRIKNIKKWLFIYIRMAINTCSFWLRHFLLGETFFFHFGDIGLVLEQVKSLEVLELFESLVWLQTSLELLLLLPLLLLMHQVYFLFHHLIGLLFNHLHYFIILLELLITHLVHTLDVLVQVTFLWERLPADKAEEGLVSSVNTHVVDDVAFLSEYSGTPLVPTKQLLNYSVSVLTLLEPNGVLAHLLEEPFPRFLLWIWAFQQRTLLLLREFKVGYRLIFIFVFFVVVLLLTLEHHLVVLIMARSLGGGVHIVTQVAWGPFLHFEQGKRLEI
jgi:hypothetical protein